MMTVVATALVLILFAWYLSVSASRLDRLHHRVETSWEHLDALLQRRAALALEISHQAELDPATALILTQSAYVSREESIVDRNDAVAAISRLTSAGETVWNIGTIQERTGDEAQTQIR